MRLLRIRFDEVRHVYYVPHQWRAYRDTCIFSTLERQFFNSSTRCAQLAGWYWIAETKQHPHYLCLPVTYMHVHFRSVNEITVYAVNAWIMYLQTSTRNSLLQIKTKQLMLIKGGLIFFFRQILHQPSNSEFIFYSFLHCPTATVLSASGLLVLFHIQTIYKAFSVDSATFFSTLANLTCNRLHCNTTWTFSDFLIQFFKNARFW